MYTNNSMDVGHANLPAFQKEQAIKMVRDKKGKLLWAVCTNGWRYEFGDGGTVRNIIEAGEELGKVKKMLSLDKAKSWSLRHS
jgi:hypothetical protein